MVIQRLLTLSAFCALCLVACGEETKAPLTEILLVVDTDLTVPDQIDEMGMIAVGPNGKKQSVSAALGDDTPNLPRTLGLVHETGPLSPLEVTVEGRRNGRPVLTRKASLAFVRGKTLVLPMHLVAACLNVSCDDDQTCTEGGDCDDIRIDPASLAPWSGDEPRLDVDGAVAETDGGGTDTDGGMSMPDGGMNMPDGGKMDAGMPADGGNGGTDSGMCVPKAETCNGLDDNCNDMIDDGVDVSSDPDNCGECGFACAANKRKCCAGVCSPNNSNC